jgi:hypothetical protein
VGYRSLKPPMTKKLLNGGLRKKEYHDLVPLSRKRSIIILSWIKAEIDLAYTSGSRKRAKAFP